jgi:hypothetical protein
LFPNGDGFADEKFNCAVPGTTDKFALVVSVDPKLTGEDPDRVCVPDPKSIVLEFWLSEAICDAVRLYVTHLKEPFVMVKEVDPASNALPSDHSELTPFTVIADANATPLVVNVNPDVDPDSVIKPVYVLVSPVAGNVTLP